MSSVDYWCLAKEKQKVSPKLVALLARLEKKQEKNKPYVPKRPVKPKASGWHQKEGHLPHGIVGPPNPNQRSKSKKYRAEWLKKKRESMGKEERSAMDRKHHAYRDPIKRKAYYQAYYLMKKKEKEAKKRNDNRTG